MTNPFNKFALIPLLAASPLFAADTPAPVSRMPETTTVGYNSALTEEAPIGETGRPEWTSARRFPGSRVYIQKEPWEVGVEGWWRMKHLRDGTYRNRFLQEIEIGLPCRFQLDLYGQVEGNGSGDYHYQSTNIELRYALADWGKLWGNPTLYGEYKFADDNWGPDVYELKLLLGDQIASRWHWAVNFVWESETGGEMEQEFKVTGGLSYTLIDQKFSVGVEGYYDHDTVKGERNNPAHLLAVGPSIQYRITDNLHVDLNCMFGLNNETERQIAYLVVGYDFGPGGHAQKVSAPISGQRD